MTWTAISVSSRIGRRVRQERDRPRPLDRQRQLALVPRAVPRDPARDDLPPLGKEVPEDARVLVVDQHRLVGAEATDLPAAHAAAAEASALALPASVAALTSILVHAGSYSGASSPRPSNSAAPSKSISSRSGRRAGRCGAGGAFSAWRTETKRRTRSISFRLRSISRSPRGVPRYSKST